MHTFKEPGKFTFDIYHVLSSQDTTLRKFFGLNGSRAVFFTASVYNPGNGHLCFG